jgi:uncharacterized protein with HEPN domain
MKDMPAARELAIPIPHPEIPWLDIIDMRHRVVHGYAFIDIEKLWYAATDGVASLIPALERILAPR